MFSFIFKQNLPHIWRNKKLWILGIFTSFLGATEETELLLNIFIPSKRNVFNFFQQLGDTQLFTSQGLQSAWKHITQEPLISLSSILLLVATVAAALVLVWLSLVAQGAIISASSKVRHSTLEKTSGYLREGKKKFWPILGINCISKLIIGLIFFVFTFPIIKNIPLMIFLTCIFIVLASILYIVMKLAICIVVVEKEKLFSAIKTAYIVFNQNKKDSVKLLMALLVVTVFSISLSIASLFVIYIPFLFIIEASVILNISAISSILFITFLLCATAFLTVFFGFISALSWISWTHFYQNIRR